jgi:hypothetical protein
MNCVDQTNRTNQRLIYIIITYYVHKPTSHQDPKSVLLSFNVLENCVVNNKHYLFLFNLGWRYARFFHGYFS